MRSVMRTARTRGSAAIARSLKIKVRFETQRVVDRFWPIAAIRTRPDKRRRRCTVRERAVHTGACYARPTCRFILASAAEEAVGTPGRNRTCDPALRRGVLYPLSYRGEGEIVPERVAAKARSRRQT